MKQNDYYSIVPGIKKSELQMFASWFHQDWKLVFPDFMQGAKMYFSDLPPNRKKVLKQELIEFLYKHSGSSNGELKKYWLELGAQGWQANLDIVETLNSFELILEQETQ